MTDELNIEDKVAEATNEENFDALAFFADASLPEGTAVLYRDSAAAVRLNEIGTEATARKELDEEEGLGVTDEIGYANPDEIDQLAARLKASAVTFKLRAIAPAARTALEKAARAKNPYTEGAANDEYWADFNGNLIAKSIVSVTNVKGQSDSNKWDRVRVEKFAEITEPSEWQKVFGKVYELNFIADAIDRAVTADFS